jgi:hypothetical protein
MDTPRISIVPRGMVVILVVLWALSVFGLNYGNYAGATAEGVSGVELWGMLLVNTLLLAVPTGLLYFSIALLIAAYRQKRENGMLEPRLLRFIYRTPRIAAIVIIAFITLFSFDVFESGGNVWQMLGAFVMHSIPSIGLAIVLALAWRREWIGAVLFAAAAVLFLAAFANDPVDGIGLILLFSGPFAVIAILFWLNWKWKNDIRPRSVA